jgi:[ribosomal protein S5]-alanine N-acetyltransferase
VTPARENPSDWDEAIRTPRLVLRRFRAGDEEDLVAAADAPRVAANLRDRFPGPYTCADAHEWIEQAESSDPLTGLAITRADRVIGGVGLIPGEDVYRHAAEIGYWLGVDHWGQGFATEAVAAFCDHVLATTGFTRLWATVFDGNPASARVLEKCGFVLEGVARRGAYKQGRYLDFQTFARVRP